MTKHGWRDPAVRMSGTGVIETWRAPTEDELVALDWELTQWRWAHPEAMPPELWWKLNQLICWTTMQYPWSREHIRFVRWWFVRQGIRCTGPLKRAYEYAEDALKGSPARAGIEMMKKDYEAVQKQRARRQRKK